jgi:predicted aspartyl protease
MRLNKPVFLILLCAGHFFYSGARAQNTPVITVPFILNFDHIIIPLSLNGSEPLNFLFDSGAGGTLITNEAADSLGFKSSVNRKNVGVSGSHKVGVIKGVKLAVEDNKIGNITLLSTDMPLEEMDDGRNVHGVIGYPILSRYIVEIDYIKSLLILYNRSSYAYTGNGQTLPINIVSNLPIAGATVVMYNDTAFEGDFLVDTGARSYMIISAPSVIHYNMADNIGDYYSVRAKIGSSQKRAKIRHGKLKSLQFAGNNFEDVPVSLSSDSKGVLSMSDIDGIIGNRLLMRYKIIFDYQHGLIHLEPNDQIGDSYETNLAGFNINFKKGKPFIKNVVDRSPADKAGLRNGDEVISINGTLVEVISSDEVRQAFSASGDKIEIVIKRNRKLKYTEFTLKALI